MSVSMEVRARLVAQAEAEKAAKKAAKRKGGAAPARHPAELTKPAAPAKKAAVKPVEPPAVVEAAPAMALPPITAPEFFGPEPDAMLKRSQAAAAAKKAALAAPVVGELNNPFNEPVAVEVAPAPPVEVAPVAPKTKRAKKPKASPAVEVAPTSPVEAPPEARAEAITSAIIASATATPLTLAPAFMASAPRTPRFIELANDGNGELRLINPARLQWIGMDTLTQGGKPCVWNVTYHLYLDADPDLCDNVSQAHASPEDARAELERAWGIVEGKGWIRGADDCGAYLINPDQIQAVGLDMYPSNPPTKKGGHGSPAQWIVSLLFSHSEDPEYSGGLHLTYSSEEERDVAYSALAQLLT